MKILLAASECVPFCKTGGLADVIGALPKEFRKKRHDVRVIIPKYRTIRGQEFGIKETGEYVRIPMGGKIEAADIRTARTEKGVRVYFVNHEGYFGRAGLYRTSEGDYPDNGERFAFFSRSILEACKAMEFRPDIIHCNDWQTGLVPAYLKTLYRTDAFFQHTATVFTIHNMAYQGIFAKTLLPVTGIPAGEFTLDKMEYYNQLNFLKTGLIYSTLLTTVSPTYAQQIQSAPEFGMGLEGVLKSRTKELVGILDGLDLDEWNPAKDSFIVKNYGPESLSVRRECKAFLQNTLRLPVSPEVPVMGMVARVDPQKGMDLLIDILPDLMARSAQIIVLGQGHPELLAKLEKLEREYPNAMRVRSDFNEPLAHHIYAGCDLFLMPSRFEPCGLGQLIAMRYGAIPVAANTGGLHDTIRPVTGRDAGTGFLFQPGSAPAFLGSVQEALHWFQDASIWSGIQRRAMSADYSWDRSSDAYLQLYRRALGRGTQIRRSQRIS